MFFVLRRKDDTSFAHTIRFETRELAERSQFFTDVDTEIVAVTYGVAWDVAGFPRDYVQTEQDDVVFGCVWVRHKTFAKRFTKKEASALVRKIRVEHDAPISEYGHAFKVVRFLRVVG